MLFLTKKTMVCIVTLGALLSINQRMHAFGPQEALAAALGLGTVYIAGVHEVDHVKKDKAIHVKALDAIAGPLQRVLNFVTSKQGLAAIGTGTAVYLAVAHGKNVKDVGALRLVRGLLTVTTSSGRTSGGGTSASQSDE